MQVSKETVKQLNGKLRRPIHISYIANYILKMPIDETRMFLNKMIDNGLIRESEYAKDYFVLS